MRVDLLKRAVGKHGPDAFHRAAARSEAAWGVDFCRHCGQEIKQVPGGHGSTWVHAHSGAVVGVTGET